jgi:hypothetical protein
MAKLSFKIGDKVKILPTYVSMKGIITKIEKVKKGEYWIHVIDIYGNTGMYNSKNSDYEMTKVLVKPHE